MLLEGNNVSFGDMGVFSMSISPSSSDELLQYMYYYNHERPHQGINGLLPVKFAENCPRIK